MSQEPDPLLLPGRPSLASPLAAAILVLVLLGLILAAFSINRSEVSSPSLIGLSAAEARAKARSAGISLVEEPEDATGLVAWQDPPAGDPMRGGAVRVIFADETTPVAIPDLDGLPLEEARTRLTETGLASGRVEFVNIPSGREGIVMQQRPEPGALAPAGSSVELWASALGISVPDLRGLAQDRALRETLRAGLVLSVLAEGNRASGRGTVYKQSPSPGAIVAPGSRLLVVVRDPPDGTGVPKRAPALFRTLARTCSFPVLYPADPIPLELVSGESNPVLRNDSAGDTGFEALYRHPSQPLVRLSLTEGNWFDPGLDWASPVAVRGTQGAIGESGRELVLVWEEKGTRYGLRGEGLTKEQLLAFAAALATVPDAEPTDQVPPASGLE